jgi:hypothetical protein
VLIRNGSSRDIRKCHRITRMRRGTPISRVAWGYYPLQKGSKGYRG